MRRITKIALVFAILLGAFLLAGLTCKKTPQTVAPVTLEPAAGHEIIGKSVQGRDIEVYTYGNGDAELLFVGGIHGGYEWNSVFLAYQFIDYLQENISAIPKNLTISVIPSLNPDGVYELIGKEGRFAISDVPTEVQIVGTGRLNADKVELNRNFDCKWKPESMWQNKAVSAGSKVFSEPEAASLREFVLKHNPDAVIFWHSQANAVYASECENGILPETLDIRNIYAKASGYEALDSFQGYEISGDAGDWLASIKIPAITVELKTHKTIEWEENLAGIEALFNYYNQ
ncbi:MAG: hypothetical protein E4H47_00640 [Parcubacteria group bacterium]|nr:MAG: hypothetical protein E4H47_00640 [Parcubacteria group bacterium]